jgi:hypothetical protein
VLVILLVTASLSLTLFYCRQWLMCLVVRLSRHHSRTCSYLRGIKRFFLYTYTALWIFHDPLARVRAAVRNRPPVRIVSYIDAHLRNATEASRLYFVDVVRQFEHTPGCLRDIVAWLVASTTPSHACSRRAVSGASVIVARSIGTPVLGGAVGAEQPNKTATAARSSARCALRRCRFPRCSPR